MMAKNVEDYIYQAIKELQKEGLISWELIVIDDGSIDNTFKIVEGLSRNDKRIIIKKNPFVGKVKGTNYGFSLTSGNIVKCIDSDDVLLRDYFNHYECFLNHDAHCHSMSIVDHNLKKMAAYRINPKMIKSTYVYAATNLISIPKSSWSFKRHIAEKIFPLPEGLPFEDVWISIIVKKYSKSIYNIPGELYLYRQHPNQTFGGIINYNSNIVIFRAKRLLKLISVLENQPVFMDGLNRDALVGIRKYNEIMSQEKLTFYNVFSSNQSFLRKLKIILIKKTPALAKYITVFKWKIDAYKN